MSWKCEKCGKSMSDGANKNKLTENYVSMVVCDKCQNEDLQENSNSEVVAHSKYIGSYNSVGGWLLVICILLTIINPIVTVLSIGFLFSVTRYVNVVIPTFTVIIMFSFIISIASSCFAFYAGYSLWKIKDNALRIMKIYLWTNLAIGIMSWLISIVSMPQSGNIILNLISPIVSFTLYYLYFLYSKRVEGTYQEIF